MNILLNIHAYVPHWNAGAQKSFHDMAKWLQAHGHKVDVIVPAVKSYVHEGVRVHQDCEKVIGLWRDADVVFTQLNCTGRSINFAKHFDKKVIHFARNDNNYEMVRVRGYNKHFIVYNSEWVKNSLGYPLRSFVMPPLVDYRYYDVGGDPFTRKYITLINHNENKGGNQLHDIALRMPNERFLCVSGGYGDQIKEDLPNVTYWPHQADIRYVYKVTRLLLMPSQYESWGRTCTEAMCNGIPVVHHPTPGLLENTNSCQPILDRNNTAEWVKLIERLATDPELYDLYSNAGRERAKQLDPERVMSGFETWLSTVVGQKRKRRVA